MNSVFLKKNNIKIIIKVENLHQDGFKFIAFNKENIELGYLTVINPTYSENIYSYNVLVNKNFRRLGIASELYNYAEFYLNKKILPYEYLNSEYESSSDAVEFWRKRGLNLNDRYRLFD